MHTLLVGLIFSLGRDGKRVHFPSMDRGVMAAVVCHHSSSFLGRLRPGSSDLFRVQPHHPTPVMQGVSILGSAKTPKVALLLLFAGVGAPSATVDRLACGGLCR